MISSQTHTHSMSKRWASAQLVRHHTLAHLCMRSFPWQKYMRQKRLKWGKFVLKWSEIPFMSANIVLIPVCVWPIGLCSLLCDLHLPTVTKTDKIYVTLLHLHGYIVDYLGGSHVVDIVIFHRDSFSKKQMLYLHNSSAACFGNGLM